MQIIQHGGTAEQLINKSKFLAWVAPCHNEKEVGAFLRAIASQHQQASHLAYAFRIKTDNRIVPRFSDAGEPSGTAGMPILQRIEGLELINVCVGVIRYYGGVNLGKGGLARAYGGTAKLALDCATTADYREMQQLSLTIAYNQLDALTKALSQMHGEVLDKQFDDQVHVVVRLPASEEHSFIKRFTSEHAD
ncbi:MAG: IMPACT family protein [Methylophilaceae bacterium]|nr:IMPACT family protein [Methylophilaceae bacterium]MDG1820836.1 IMPACT family protein [Methylophilaceae bacterium]